MSPGGHLATTLAACAVTAAGTGSWPLAAGVAVGGFLIDVDHAVDYVVVEGQRDWRPRTFLRYYLEGRVNYSVLVLHSYECLGLLGLLAWWTGWLPLVGYLLGAVMHLALDIAFNGKLVPTNIFAFYSFAYRAAHRFSGPALHGAVERAATPANFWHAFFRGSALPDEPPPPRTGSGGEDPRGVATDLRVATDGYAGRPIGGGANEPLTGLRVGRG